ncbi:MAG: response regulator, partial [Lachnospiraceae bacterium]|nr:response regulator [Lachnospiraceae bacterium]
VQPQIKSKKQHFNVFIHDISAEDVCCDGVRLNQVILNLISNAVKFTPEEGFIHVAMYEEPSPKGSDYIRINLQVKDNGIGMSEEFQAEIFESFTREDRKRVHKTEGTGLGMAITKYIVDAMGGSIEVKSKQGEGTEFNITLDFEIAKEKEKDMFLPNCDMLVVDDNRQLCESVIQSLESIGISAEWTMDGESAVRMVHERHQKNEDYQFILLDWKLPGMDGIDTAKELRKQLGDNVPILLISAYDWSEIEHDARSAGITGFISKPLFKSTLYYGLKPYTEHFETETEEEEDIMSLHLQGKKILLAEDNELNWEVASELLQELGLELEWAENGKICVDKFRESPLGFYDGILMDIRMPVMNGYEATTEIRSMEREDSNLPIIAMTADAFSEDVKRCLDCGMDAHVAKPIDVKEIARLLEKHFTGQI